MIQCLAERRHQIGYGRAFQVIAGAIDFSFQLSLSFLYYHQGSAYRGEAVSCNEY
jgi:hypothetical protein